MNIVLFDTADRIQLYPFSATRPLAAIRIGIFTIGEWWENYFQQKVSVLTEAYLQEKYPLDMETDNLLINAAVIPNPYFLAELDKLQPGEALVQDELLLAAKVDVITNYDVQKLKPTSYKHHKKINQPARVLQFPWQIFQWNDEAIRLHFPIITKARVSASISSTNKIIAPQHIFLEEGARVEHAMLNASTGPIYIGKNCEIMEGSMIRGPFAMLEGSVVKMGTKIYGATTLGPQCMAGGEIKNSVLFGFSNKAHDGYLGDSVLGEWCNLGAGTSNSNLKNTAGIVNVWNKSAGEFMPSGTKCGLMMGDYSRCAINSAFNTGTVTGVCANIFGAGLLPKYIPDFSWGVTNENRYQLNRAWDDINNWKQLKNQLITNHEKNILKHIFEHL